MTTQIVTEVEAALQAALTKAKSIGHAIEADIASVLGKLRGDETQLQAEAETDAVQVGHAAAPVVAEAKADAEQVAEQAVADAKDLADGSVPPASA